VTRAAADALAAQLDLDVDDLAICHACLSFVSFAIDSDDDREVTLWTRRIAPDLWNEGLEQPVRMALRRARERGVAGADEAIRLVDEKGAAELRRARDRQEAGRRALGEGPRRFAQDGLRTLAARAGRWLTSRRDY